MTDSQRPAYDPHPAGAPAPRPKPAVMRLQTWVNVVLVITLLASCSAASNSGDLITGSSTDGAASATEVEDLCRLMGALATKQGVDLQTVFAGTNQSSRCQEVAGTTPAP